MLDGYTVDVVEWQDTNEDVFLPREMFAFCSDILESIDDKIRMAEHDAFGTASRTGARDHVSFAVLNACYNKMYMLTYTAKMQDLSGHFSSLFDICSYLPCCGSP